MFLNFLNRWSIVVDGSTRGNALEITNEIWETPVEFFRAICFRRVLGVKMVSKVVQYFFQGDIYPGLVSVLFLDSSLEKKVFPALC